MKADELRNMSEQDLAAALRDSQKTLFDLRFQSATDRLETPSMMRKARRDIARVKTILREREMKQAPAAAAAAK
jgi:large subunit ribosomal protein L29